MPNSFQIFASHFGFPVPALLTRFYGSESFRKSFPKVFRPKNVPYVVEIQYLLDINDYRNYDLPSGRLAFAVNSDGREMILDLNSDELDVLQNENGKIDYLGVSLKDLVESDSVLPT